MENTETGQIVEDVEKEGMVPKMQPDIIFVNSVNLLIFIYMTIYWDDFGTFSHIYSSYIQPKCGLSGV